MWNPVNCLPQRGGIVLFFLLFLAYSMLRPVRETMGIAGGVQEFAVAFYGYFCRFHRDPVFIWVGILKSAKKGHSSVDVRFFHS